MDYKKPKYKIGDVVVYKTVGGCFYQTRLMLAFFSKNEWFYSSCNEFEDNIKESQIIEKL